MACAFQTVLSYTAWVIDWGFFFKWSISHAKRNKLVHALNGNPAVRPSFLSGCIARLIETNTAGEVLQVYKLLRIAFTGKNVPWEILDLVIRYCLPISFLGDNSLPCRWPVDSLDDEKTEKVCQCPLPISCQNTYLDSSTLMRCPDCLLCGRTISKEPLHWGIIALHDPLIGMTCAHVTFSKKPQQLDQLLTTILSLGMTASERNVAPALGTWGRNGYCSRSIPTPYRALKDWLYQQASSVTDRSDGKNQANQHPAYVYGPSDQECRSLQGEPAIWSPGWTRLLVWAHPHTQGRSPHVRFVWHAQEGEQELPHGEVGNREFEPRRERNCSTDVPIATISGPYREEAAGARWFNVDITAGATVGAHCTCVVNCRVDETLGVTTIMKSCKQCGDSTGHDIKVPGSGSPSALAEALLLHAMLGIATGIHELGASQQATAQKNTHIENAIKVVCNQVQAFAQELAILENEEDKNGTGVRCVQIHARLMLRRVAPHNEIRSGLMTYVMLPVLETLRRRCLPSFANPCPDTPYSSTQAKLYLLGRRPDWLPLETVFNLAKGEHWLPLEGAFDKK
eukprot:g57133.t1